MALARAEDEWEAAEQGCAADLEVAQIELGKVQRELQAAEESLDLLTLRASRSGPFLVTGPRWRGRHLGVGDTVWPGWPVAEIADTSEMQVEAWLLDADDGRVREGAPAVLRVRHLSGRAASGDGFSRSHPPRGKLGEHGARRAFQVIVALDGEAGKRVTPGMSVRVEIESGRYPGVLLVPRVALDLTTTPPRAALEGGGTRPVTIGACGPQACVVEAGLAEGERLRPCVGERRVRRRWLIAGAVGVAAVSVAAWTLARGSGQRGDWVRAEKADIVLTVPITGVLAAVRSIQIGPPVVWGQWEFKIAAMAPEGADVKAGDMVLELDASERRRDLERRRADRDAAREQLEKRRRELGLAGPRRRPQARRGRGAPADGRGSRPGAPTTSCRPRSCSRSCSTWGSPGRRWSSSICRSRPVARRGAPSWPPSRMPSTGPRCGSSVSRRRSAACG